MTESTSEAPEIDHDLGPGARAAVDGDMSKPYIPDPGELAPSAVPVEEVPVVPEVPPTPPILSGGDVPPEHQS